MLKFVGAPNLSGSFYNANDATQQHTLGMRAFDEDGGEWVYVRNDGLALARGKVVMPLAAVDADTWLSSTDKLTVTNTGATMTAGAYAGWYFYVNDGTGEGQHRKIVSNDATSCVLDEALTTALSITDSDALIYHPFVVDTATVSAQIPPIGVAQNTITAAYYGWVKTGGVAEVLAGGALVRGLYAKLADNIAGQVLVAADGNDLYDVTVIGIALQANTSADVGVPVLLNLR